MKIAIKEIKKTYDPFRMDNGGSIYSVGARVVDHEGVECYAKVRAFKENLIQVGEFERDVNVQNIKFQTVSYTDRDGIQKEIKQYTLYALKKNDFKKGFQFKPRMTKENFIDIVDTCNGLSSLYVDQIDDMIEKAKLRWSWFSAILKGYLENVEIKQEENSDVKSNVEIKKDDDTEIPF